MPILSTTVIKVFTFVCVYLRAISKTALASRVTVTILKGCLYTSAVNLG